MRTKFKQIAVSGVPLVAASGQWASAPACVLFGLTEAGDVVRWDDRREIWIELPDAFEPMWPRP